MSESTCATKHPTEEARAALEGEYYLFTLLGNILYRKPNSAFLATVANNRVFDEIPFRSANPLIRSSFTKLQEWNDTCSTPFSDTDFETISLDYTRLFVGLNKVPAPLWESVYFNRERMVFQEQTMDVRNWYRRYRLQVESYEHEPDDHIGSELLFIGHLSRLAKEAFENGDTDRALEILSDQSRFIKEHPGQWCGRWAELIATSAQSVFFVACSQLVCAAIQEALHQNATLMSL